MIDTHCHLEYEGLGERVDEVVSAASSKGVVQMITIGCSLERAGRAVSIAEQFDEQVYAAIGVHPETYGGEAQYPPADVDPQHAVDELRNIAEEHVRVVKAIGECGLDYHRPEHAATADQQRDLFIAQLDLAKELDLPVVLHIRDAFEDALAILQDYKDLSGVVHCFTGDLFEAKRCLDQGWYLGFTGIVTFGDHSIEDVVREVPIDRMLLETDAPFLTPVPHRGKRPNEPQYVVHVAERISALKNLSLAEVDEQTTQNARDLFSLPQFSLF